MQDESSTVSFCPSFSSYSLHNSNQNHKLSTIAARVGDEESRINDDDDDDDFEFILPRASISRSEKEEEEETRLVLPLFNRDLRQKEESGTDVAPPPPSLLVSLGKLFVEDRGEEDPPSSSSSSSSAGEDEEVDGESPGTYCIWKPNFSPSPARCKKSNSTGSSSSAVAAAAAKAKPNWRLRNLLRRSSSDGKDSNYLVANSSPRINNNNNNNNKAEGRSKAAASSLHLTKAKGKGQVSAHEALYVRNKALREGDKRRSYLPYRQDLVGLLTFPHF